MNKRNTMRVTLVLAAGALAVAGVSAAQPSVAASSAEVYVVQGLPNTLLDLTIDGKSVGSNIKASAVAGPYKMKAGKHTIVASAGGKVQSQGTINVSAGSSTDVVVHLPGPGKTAPVMTQYRNNLSSVPKDKASLTVAHTAAVPPADIRVNGKVLFADVANGESLNLVVPVATYSVDIVPTGKSSPVYLGPLQLTVKGGSLNRVYAVGNPDSKTMNVAVHVLDVKPTGSTKPKKVDTGTGGQAVGATSTLYVPIG